MFLKKPTGDISSFTERTGERGNRTEQEKGEQERLRIRIEYKGRGAKVEGCCSCASRAV